MKKSLGKAAIIGAGLTGLIAAYDLCAAGYSVSIFEKDSFAGGLCSCFPAEPGKDPVERFYHHLLTSDSAAINLFDDFGLLDQLEWLPPVNSFISNNKAYRFSSPLDLLRFEPIPPLRRLLMGLHILGTRFIRNWKSLSHLTAADWVRRHTGEKVFQTVWQPLLRAKFGSEAENVSAVWLANKLKLRGSSQKISVGGECLGYPRGSFAVLINAMVSRLRQNGAEIYLNEAVTEIRSAKASATTGHDLNNNSNPEFIVCSKNRQERFARVLCTISPAGFSSIMPEQPEETRRQWQQIRYQANLCMMLETDRQLSPYYWTSVADNDYPFVAIIEHTNLISKDRYQNHIIYVSSYLSPDHQLFRADDREIAVVFEDGLKRLIPAFSQIKILRRVISRAEHAQPIVTTDYAGRIPSFETPVSGCWMASMAQIFPEDRGINYAVRLGREAARRIIQSET